jgi:hypothetical protein
MSVGTCRNPSTVRDGERITFGGRHLLTLGGDLARGAKYSGRYANVGW